MILKRGEPVIEFVPWWADAAILAPTDKFPIRMCAIGMGDMDKLRENPKTSALVGFPVYIACKKSGARVHLWPAPNADYEMVPR